MLLPRYYFVSDSRNDLHGMIRQKYSNGRWIGLTLSECPGCLSYFHFAPFLFVMALLGCSVLAFLGFPLFFVHSFDNLRNV